MAGGISETGATYSKTVGLVYVFNLIVGTGALTMPKAFHLAGWLLSLITIILLSFMSYLTVTFVTEAMGIANAHLKGNKAVNVDREIDTDETEPLLNQNNGSINPTHEPSSPYEITERTELGQMANMFFNKVGVTLFNLCMIIYLYGDLAIYAAAVPKSIRDISCTYELPLNLSCNQSLTDSDLCWDNSDISRMTMYRFCVLGFILCLGGFTFFNAQKTKYLQIVTSFSRWLAFGIMVILAVIRLEKKEGQGHPVAADFSGMPALFGVCIYSFMCHHSLPSLITPIKNKSKLNILLASDFIMILCFYLLVSFTGIFAFNKIDDIYTLNFLPDECKQANPITSIKFIQYFLALFPVFTLSTNFPIISITLRNNLKNIFYKEGRPFTFCVDRIFFPLLALIPPVCIALGTDEVEFLVGITGSYAGAAIQYIIPALLVYYARKQTYLLNAGDNIHKSPFKGTGWVIFVCVWAGLCIVLVTVNHIITKS